MLFDAVLTAATLLTVLSSIRALGEVCEAIPGCFHSLIISALTLAVIIRSALTCVIFFRRFHLFQSLKVFDKNLISSEI